MSYHSIERIRVLAAIHADPEWLDNMAWALAIDRSELAMLWFTSAMGLKRSSYELSRLLREKTRDHDTLWAVARIRFNQDTISKSRKLDAWFQFGQAWKDFKKAIMEVLCR